MLADLFRPFFRTAPAAAQLRRSGADNRRTRRNGPESSC
jgi:hypothetical protein